MSTKLIPRIWPHKIMSSQEFKAWSIVNDIIFYYPTYGYFNVDYMNLGGYFQIFGTIFYTAKKKQDFNNMKELSLTRIIYPKTEEWLRVCEQVHRNGFLLLTIPSIYR